MNIWISNYTCKFIYEIFTCTVAWARSYIEAQHSRSLRNKSNLTALESYSIINVANNDNSYDTTATNKNIQSQNDVLKNIVLWFIDIVILMILICPFISRLQAYNYKLILVPYFWILQVKRILGRRKSITHAVKTLISI